MSIQPRSQAACWVTALALVASACVQGPAFGQKLPQAPPSQAPPSQATTTTAPAPVLTPTAANSVPDVAFAAFQRGTYVQAMREAMKRINANPKDAPAMTLVGELFKDGLGVRVNYPEAAKWFKLAADLGDRQAQFALGIANLSGAGIPKDRKQAQVWFEKAAAQGHAGALYNLGIIAIEGDIQDFAKAADLFRRGAEAGDMDAAFALSTLIHAGKGVPEDHTSAAEWMRKAADAHNTAAELEYGIALFNGDGVAKDEAGAAKYFQKAAASNNPVAQNRLARMLVTGRGLPKNMVDAMKWHLLARSAGVQDAFLEQQMATLSPRERDAVAEAVRKYASKYTAN